MVLLGGRTTCWRRVLIMRPCVASFWRLKNEDAVGMTPPLIVLVLTMSKKGASATTQANLLYVLLVTDKKERRTFFMGTFWGI